MNRPTPETTRTNAAEIDTLSPAMANASRASFKDNVGTYYKTQLWLATQDGTRSGGSSIGTVLACPQSCAAARPGYLSLTAALKKIYLNTPEWMREIIYTDDSIPDHKTFRKYQRLLGYHRVSNDASARGCGHISRNVALTKVQLNGGTLQETPDAKTYSSLVFDGMQLGDTYLAANIHIYLGDWTAVPGKPVQMVIDDIDSDDRPIGVSGCPG